MPQHYDEIRKTLELLFEPGDVVELRALNTRQGTVSGYFTNFDALAREAARLDGQVPAVYATINPVRPDLLARAVNRCIPGAKNTTADRDILRRHWLLFDFDPVRPSGISATDAEHEAALARGREFQTWLVSHGVPAASIILVDSGNGAHVYLGVSLPNDAVSRTLVDRMLQAAALVHSDDAIAVDTTVGNAARIVKLAGTLAMKGDPTEDRPHRRSRLLERPEQPVICPVDILERIAAFAPEQPAHAAHGGTNSRFDVERWLAAHGLSVWHRGPWNGGVRWVLDLCPWAEHTNHSAFVIQFPNGAVCAGCHHNTCAGRNWHALRDKVEPGWRNREHSYSDRQSNRPFVPPVRPVTITADELMRKTLPEPRWVVPDLIPEGASALVSRPKIGKSWFLLQTAIAVTSGGSMAGLPVRQGSALYLALEDTERRLQDRMRRQLNGEPAPAALTLATVWPRLDNGFIEQVEKWLEAHADAAFIGIDTLVKIRPPRRRDGDRYMEDYAVVEAVKSMADRHHVGVVLAHHDRKADAEDRLDRVSGTIGITGALDTILLLGRARGEHEATLFVTGRDIDERELALRWDPQFCIWTFLGDAETARRSAERQAIIVLLAAEGPLRAKDIAKTLGRRDNSTRWLLAEMAKAGEVVGVAGIYAVPTAAARPTAPTSPTPPTPPTAPTPAASVGSHGAAPQHRRRSAGRAGQASAQSVGGVGSVGAVDATCTGGSDVRLAYILAFGESGDYPALVFGPGRAIVGGREAWKRFLHRPSSRDLDLVVAACKAIDNSRSMGEVPPIGARPCQACRHTVLWRSAASMWMCRRCNPPRDRPAVTGWCVRTRRGRWEMIPPRLRGTVARARLVAVMGR